MVRSAESRGRLFASRGDFVARTLAELTEAIRHFDEVIKAHPHTPWAALAEREGLIRG